MKKHISLSDIQKKNGPTLIREGKKQILVMEVSGEIVAIDNRCPHEGFPLSEGSVDTKECVLTCNWHNWKFDLRSGENLLQGDNVRSYPVTVSGDIVEVDIADETKEEQARKILKGFDSAMEHRDYGQLSREVLRFILSGNDPYKLIERGILLSYQKFEYGMTHAYAALADWICLYEERESLEEKTIALTECLFHMSFDVFRQKDFPYAKEEIAHFVEGELFQAIEDENLSKSESLINKAFDEGKDFKDLYEVLAKQGLEHYSDFGHSLIYIAKVKELCERLENREVQRALLLCLVRSLVYQTREDLIPKFRSYGRILEKLESGDFLGERVIFPIKGSIRETLDWAAFELKEGKIDQSFRKLLEGNARNLLGFDASYQHKKEVLPGADVSVLSFTHAMTFTEAVHGVCSDFPELWQRGILQMALFFGRNTPYLAKGQNDEMYKVGEGFYEKCQQASLDHGLPLPIYLCHILKTSTAIWKLANLYPEQKEVLLMGLNKFLSSEIRMRNPKKVFYQSYDLVSKDFE